jgi:FdhE protein
MIAHPPPPADQVKQAAASLRAILPDYGHLLSFYERLFSAQETIQLQIALAPIVIAAEVLETKRQARLPLAKANEFVFDVSAGRELLGQICRLVQPSQGEMALSAERIAAELDNESAVESLFRHLLEDDDAFFNHTAHRIGCDKEVLAFVAYNSLKPSLVICAQQLALYLNDRGKWTSSICPVCGNRPAIGVLDNEGRRSLFCSFCWHPWPVSRIGCPYCGNRDGQTLCYLCTENEKAVRADCCDRCRKYIKTVDMRAANRPVYPPLEQMASLHLDLKARESGYATGLGICLYGE